MKKLLSKSILIFLMSVALCVNTVFAAQDPVDMLQSVADQMIQALKENKASLKTNPSIVYSYANRIVVPHADLAEMAKRVLPPDVWARATPEQRAQFQREFTTLLVRTYASALADYHDEVVKFYPVRGGYAGKSSVRVNSQIIRSNGPSIPVNYRLLWSGGEWKLYDMSVEGVSLLESFRSQFADKLATGDINDLIRAISAHTGRGG